MFQAVWDVADLPLREAMDLAYLSAQRPADVLKADERDIRDDHLHVRQNKTGMQLRIQIVGELAKLLARIKERKSLFKVRSTRLIVDEAGKPLGQSALRFRFDHARAAADVAKKDFQFRDIRAKAGTDKEASGDMRQAQTLHFWGTEA